MACSCSYSPATIAPLRQRIREVMWALSPHARSSAMIEPSEGDARLVPRDSDTFRDLESIVNTAPPSEFEKIFEALGYYGAVKRTFDYGVMDCIVGGRVVHEPYGPPIVTQRCTFWCSRVDTFVVLHGMDAIRDALESRK